MPFKEDLKKWMDMEETIIELLSEDLHLFKNPKEKEADLLIVEHSAEVKYDVSSYKYWNYFLEVECNWKRSWVYKEEKIPVKWWIHTDWEEALLINMKFLRRWVENRMNECNANSSKTSRWARIIESGWDWGRVKWIVVPKDELRNIAYKIYYLNKKNE